MKNLEYGRVYRRREFSTNSGPWASQYPSLEIKGEGSVTMYVSNLPKQVNGCLYKCPIDNTLTDIQTKMTVIKDCNGNPQKLCAGIHDAKLSTVWICFIWNGDSVEPPELRDSYLIDWELSYRQDTHGDI